MQHFVVGSSAFVRRAVFLALILIPSKTIALPVVNGDFASGLSGWTTAGEVTSANENAILGENDGFSSRLFQAVEIAPGEFTFSFDFLGAFSQAIPNGTFPDTAFATLYYIDNPAAFDPDNGSFGDAALLLSQDFQNLSNEIPTATIAAAPQGNGWSRYSVSLISAFTHVIPMFELFNLNFLDDTVFRIDNISISQSQVPEPASLAMLSSGILGLVLRRRRSRHYSHTELA